MTNAIIINVLVFCLKKTLFPTTLFLSQFILQSFFKKINIVQFFSSENRTNVLFKTTLYPTTYYFFPNNAIFYNLVLSMLFSKEKLYYDIKIYCYDLTV
jgi:hypothetical protein